MPTGDFEWVRQRAVDKAAARLQHAEAQKAARERKRAEKDAFSRMDAAGALTRRHDS